MSDSEPSDREAFLAAVLNLERAEQILVQLGSTRQAMSVGPPLDDLQGLTAEVCQRGRDYGIVSKSMTDIDIKRTAEKHFSTDDERDER